MTDKYIEDKAKLILQHPDQSTVEANIRTIIASTKNAIKRELAGWCDDTNEQHLIEQAIDKAAINKD